MGSYQDCQDNHEPDLDVHEDLENVGQLEVVVLDTGLVNGDVPQEGDLLGLGEECGRHGRIGQYEVRRDTNQARDDAEDNEHQLPSLEA